MEIRGAARVVHGVVGACWEKVQEYMYVCLQQKTSERRSKSGAALVLNEKLWCGVNAEKLPADPRRACVVFMGEKLPGTLHGYRTWFHEPFG